MEYRRLGQSGLKISEISLGSWMTYGGYVENQQAEAIIDAAYRHGINFFDTANAYMRGGAEEVVGEALSKYPRSSYVLATKVWAKMGDGPNDRGLSRKHIVEQCEASLKRLNKEYIDLYYCHSFDPDTPMLETIRGMDDLVRQGKVLYVGVSNWSAAQITEAIHLADKHLLDRIVASQPAYNMLNRSIEQELLPQSAKYGVGQVVYSPLAQGVLSGKYTNATEVPAGTRAEHANKTLYFKKYLTEQNLGKIRKLQVLADQLALTMPQLALAWNLRDTRISSCIIGASRVEQLEDNVKAAGLRLELVSVMKIEEILTEVL